MTRHQYVDRASGRVMNEVFAGDRLVSFLCARHREDPAWLYRTVTSARMSRALAWLYFDARRESPSAMRQRLAEGLGIDFDECLDPPERLRTARDVFERRIRYWDVRPMDDAAAAVVAPADARMIPGSFAETSTLFLKEKFVAFEALFGRERSAWREAFRGGDFAVFRLTPDKYHYNHVPVDGVVQDIYEVDGRYQSCHPSVVVAQATPYSTNRRTVTIVDTDVPGGTGVGLVAMLEVVALMIGHIDQCYSETRYEAPVPVTPGLRLRRGCPKSLYRPGSSVDVLVFQPGRVRFADDLLINRERHDVHSRYSAGFGRALVETDVHVRETIAHAARRGGRP